MSVISYLLFVSSLKVLHHLHRVLNSHFLGVSLDQTNAFIHCVMYPWRHLYMSNRNLSLRYLNFYIFIYLRPLQKLGFRLVNLLELLAVDCLTIQFTWTQTLKFSKKKKIICSFHNSDFFILINILFLFISFYFKWCFKGECVLIGERPEAINGQWGEWAEWTTCTRTCGAGVSTSQRHCDNPP